MRATLFLVLSSGLSVVVGCTGGRDPEPQPVPTTPVPDTGASERSRLDPGTRAFPCTFREITRAAGIQFRHETGAQGEKLLPETMGAGCAFLDFDGDESLDIYLVNGSFWPGHDSADHTPPPTSALYRGRGDGTFVDVTAETGAGLVLQGMAAAPADYDGDGDEDIFVTGVGRCVLLRQDGGRFFDATAYAGLETAEWVDSDGVSHPAWSTAAAWGDLDGDGDLDLLVAGYVEWDRSLEIFTTLDGFTKAFTTPDGYRGLPCRLFLNRGDGRFADATGTSGLVKHLGKALGLAFWDFDSDGRLDFVVANSTRPNFLFLNRGGGRFEEVGLGAGIAYDETGRAMAGMGVDVADYANRGEPSIVISTYAEEPVSLYTREANGRFRSDATRVGIAQPTYTNLSFGVAFLDLDLDGIQDLVLANGHIEPDAERNFSNQTYAQSAQLFHGRAFGGFEDVSTRVGADFTVPRVARGLAAGDIDSDGDLDLLLTTNGGPPALLENVRDSGMPSHYLRVRLRGRSPNTRAIGSVVTLVTGRVQERRLVRTGSSYLSQSDVVPTFGLGGTIRVDELRVRWPTGRETLVEVQGVDRTIEVREP